MPSPARRTTPAQYLSAPSEPRRPELKALDTSIRNAAPDLTPHIAHSDTMIGYGHYHSRYATGREGDCPIVALSSRAQYISLHVAGHRGRKSIAEAAKTRLGKVSVGKACIRTKKLADLNMPEAMALVREASALSDNGSTGFAL